jgi:hypothetical protein
MPMSWARDLTGKALLRIWPILAIALEACHAGLPHTENAGATTGSEPTADQPVLARSARRLGSGE